MLEDIDPIVRIFGVGTAVLGVGYAVFEKDIKRMLAFHTISQLGFVLAAPEVGGFYALTHGLVKSALFLVGGNLPSRNLKELHHKPMTNSLWIALTMASFSISGFPLLSGFGAKVLTMKNLMPWQVIGMNIAALGTAISFAKLIFLPHEPAKEGDKKQSMGFWLAVVVLIGGLVGANVVYYQAYTLANIIKPLATIALGWLAYFLIFRNSKIKLPRILEELDHLMGMMSLMLLLLFWMVWP
jgi:multicomponent Na+:H+ antiporter subunit D